MHDYIYIYELVSRSQLKVISACNARWRWVMIRRSRSALLHVSRPTAVGVLPAYMTCANCLVRPPAAPPVISICHCRRARCSSSIIPTLLLPLPLRNKARRRRRPCAAGAACRFTSRFPADPFRAR